MISWTPTLDAEMRDAVSSGVSYGQFAAARGLTRNQALGRALRLRRAGAAGFDRRKSGRTRQPDTNLAPTPRSKVVQEVIPPNPSPKEKRVVANKKSDWIPENDRLSGLPLWDVISPDRVGIGKDIVDLKPGDCRWLAASGKYCGHTVHSRSYCEFHYGLVYLTDRRKLNVRQFQRDAAVPCAEV
jgi:hypothetical protein